jgi:hypothetical protein
MIHLLVMASFEIGDCPGFHDNDWLLGAEQDSPDLNITALSFAEKRSRYRLFQLYILYGLNILIALCQLYILYILFVNNLCFSWQEEAYDARSCDDR